MIEIKDLTFTYQGRDEPTLKEMNLYVRAGEFILVAGPTGCGKTTLLRTLNGLIPHETAGIMEGSVTVAGKETKKSSMADLTRMVGLLFQNPDLMLFCNSVGEEVEFGPRALKFSTDKLFGILSDTLAALTMSDLEEEAPFSLSSGQRLRVATASIASMDPEIFLLDEPTQGQDRVNVEGLMNYLKIRSRKGTAILFITHNLDVALRYADRILFMNGGRIVEDV